MPSPSQLLFLYTCAATLALLHAAACSNDKLPYKCTCKNPTAIQCTGLSDFPPPGNLTDITDFIFNNCDFGTIGGNKIPDYAQAVTLTLANCRIKTLQEDAFLSVLNLEQLQITGNLLRNISRQVLSLPNLNHLVLNRNALTTLPSDVFNDLPKLQNLDLSSNDISSLPENIFEKNTELTEISLTFNKFTEIPKAVTDRSLKRLSLSGNLIGPLTAGKFELLPDLEHLELESCDIKAVDVQAFSGLTKVVELYLGYNDIQEIPRDTFAPMRSTLQNLWLDNNKLTTLENGTLPLGGTLKNIQLGHNPWHCDPKIAWMKDLHLEEIDHENVTCSTPPHLAGRKLANVTREMLHEEPPTRSKSMIAAAIAIPIIVICALLIFCILLRLYQNRRQRKRAQVRYSAVYRETTEPTKPGHHHRPTSVI